MKKAIIFITALLLPFLFSGCSDDKLEEVYLLGLGGEDYVWTDLDQWLYDNMILPFNIEVKYRWDRFELDNDKTLVPVDETKVKPLIRTMQNVWLDPYIELGGESFIQTYAAKKIVFVGSLRYNGSTVTNGEAEGGRKIVFFRVNFWTPENRDLTQDIMRTAHHEFAHILHQTKTYPEEFIYITPGAYTSSWNNRNETQALQLGLISPYAGAHAGEDMAEMTARILVYGRDWFEAKVAQAQELWNSSTTLDYNPADALRQKETILVNYMKDTWGIDMYDSDDGTPGLVTLVQKGFYKNIN